MRSNGRRFRWTVPTLCGRLALAVLLLPPLPGKGQETRGQAEIALQGYYLGGNGERGIASTGIAADFQYYFEKSGKLAGRLESYRDGRQRRSGENYISLSGLPWRGMRWNLTGGDYRLGLRPEGAGPGNLYFPELHLRGGRVDVVSGQLTFSVFGGELMVLQGPRMPYYYGTPQRMAGGTTAWKPVESLAVQSTLLRTATDVEGLAERSYLLPEGRRFGVSTQWLTNAGWKPGKGLKLYGEAAVTGATGLYGRSRADLSPFSATASAEWEGSRAQARGNWVRQGAGYMPLAGYYLGDRQGPYGEVNVRATQRVSLYATGSRFENNVDRQPAAPTLRSESSSAGVTAETPGRVYVMGNLSMIGLESRARRDAQAEKMRNRLAMVSAMRTIRRTNVRAGWRQVEVWQSAGKSTIRSVEGDGSVTMGHFAAGGGTRLDSTASGGVGGGRRNSLFFRGSFQANFRGYSLYGSAEAGRDLLNETLFMANQMRSTVVGGSARLGRNWSLSADLTRFSLNSAMNPQSAFLLANAGAPVQVMMEGLNRWNLFFRLSRSLRWGAPLPPQFSGRSVEQMYPVMGTVEGFVVEQAAGGTAPAAGVAVTLDGGRTEVTDGEGRYRFADVAQGRHGVALAERELPAEYDAATAPRFEVAVAPRRAARADFAVTRLSSLTGRIVAPAGVDVAEVVIRLSRGGKYTTPEPDGSFTFFNLRAGRYEVMVEAASLPEGCRLTTPERMEVELGLGGEPPVVLFGLRMEQKVKPVREVNLAAR